MTQTIDIKVTENGFEPNELRVRANQPVQLKVKRTFARTCATSIEVPGLIPRTRLPLGETVVVEFVPSQAGTFRFGCSMNQHIGGNLVIEG